GREPAMPTFIIERTVPGASQLSEEQLREIARTSNGGVEDLGVPYRWLHSYAAGDKIYCVHETANADIVRAHAPPRRLPRARVAVISGVIGPRTADGRTSARRARRALRARSSGGVLSSREGRPPAGAAGLPSRVYVSF